MDVVIEVNCVSASRWLNTYVQLIKINVTCVICLTILIILVSPKKYGSEESSNNEAIYKVIIVSTVLGPNCYY